jgi:hypothetical protein
MRLVPSSACGLIFDNLFQGFFIIFFEFPQIKVLRVQGRRIHGNAAALGILAYPGQERAPIGRVITPARQKLVSP